MATPILNTNWNWQFKLWRFIKYSHYRK